MVSDVSPPVDWAGRWAWTSGRHAVSGHQAVCPPQWDAFPESRSGWLKTSTGCTMSDDRFVKEPEQGPPL